MPTGVVVSPVTRVQRHFSGPIFATSLETEWSRGAGRDPAADPDSSLEPEWREGSQGVSLGQIDYSASSD